ncbi:MAG: hypothetical protein PW845_18615 [Pseudomonas sp.]|nr:hypothetical protein [Pseudomonas sp.]
MINYELMFQSESAENIIKYLVSLDGAPDLPTLDRIFLRQRGHTTASHDLLSLYREMTRKGLIQRTDSKGKLGKGPNWTEPEFMKTKKYG